MKTLWLSKCCCGQGSLQTGCKIIAAVEIVLGGITFILGCVYEYANVPGYIGEILTNDVRTLLGFLDPLPPLFAFWTEIE